MCSFAATSALVSPMATRDASAEVAQPQVAALRIFSVADSLRSQVVRRIFDPRPPTPSRG